MRRPDRDETAHNSVRDIKSALKDGAVMNERFTELMNDVGSLSVGFNHPIRTQRPEAYLEGYEDGFASARTQAASLVIAAGMAEERCCDNGVFGQPHVCQKQPAPGTGVLDVRLLQIAVLAILDKASAYEWSVQGFGMLRLYIRGIGRLHIWDHRLRYPGVSVIHTHSWDLKSTIVSGKIVNQRYERRLQEYYGRRYVGKRLITGYNTSDVRPLSETSLLELTPETYGPGDVYTQKADEIHQTFADDSTVTLMERKEDENGQADVYWKVGTEWGTAKPRPATAEEIERTVTRAKIKLEDDLGL